MTTILSTSCQCSKCMLKYKCNMYKDIVMGQRVMSSLTKQYPDTLHIRVQVEKCPKRKQDHVVCEVNGK